MNTLSGDNHDVANIYKILSYLEDSYKGYKEAAKVVINPQMEICFSMVAKEREGTMNELKRLVNVSPISEFTEGSFIGELHRIFLDLKSLVSNIDGIINEIKRGENVLIDVYKESIRQTARKDLRDLFMNQLKGIESDLIKIDQLSLSVKD